MRKKIIDAQNKKIGRIATEAAMALMGKDSPDYAPNKVANVQVEIINAGSMDINSVKKEESNSFRVSWRSEERKTRRIDGSQRTSRSFEKSDQRHASRQ